MSELQRPTIVFGKAALTIEQLLALARGNACAMLDGSPGYRDTLEQGHRLLQEALSRGQAVYGVSTGVGDSCGVDVPAELLAQLPRNLFRMHGTGTGHILAKVEGATVVAARLASLARGYSGVRPQVLQGLCALLNHGIVPCIPSEGSVGASGDLTPLSYVAACLAGERDVLHAGHTRPAAQALMLCGLAPIELAPKESLAIMNGTSMMTGLACLAFERARRLARLASALTAMASEATRGAAGHFDDRIFALKPHPGQRACARWIRDDLEYDPRAVSDQARLQDRYSIRCAPHVIGVLLDALPLSRQVIETELNSVNDNPIIDFETGRILSGGNFYGGHIAFAMDSLKALVASVADLLDRQLALLLNPVSNGGLSANLVGVDGAAATVNFGFKAMGISTSALAAEALKLTMPASAFSRSTENHNQDKVSMGTIAARDCLRVLELSETVAIIHLLALCQAADLLGLARTHDRGRALHAAVRRVADTLREDRAMDCDIQAVLTLYRDEELPIGEIDFA